MSTPVEQVLQHITLPFELRDYQVEDINRFAYVKSCGLYLDLGLGKTVSATIIGTYKLLNGFHSCFVLCPESLITQWVEFLTEVGIVAKAFRSTPKQREKMDLDVDFLVMSYQIYQREYHRLKDINAYYIVDEATCLCNTNNKLYKMLNGGQIKRKKKVEGKLKPQIVVENYDNVNKGCALLTATPINKPDNAYGLIKITSPETYRTYSHFLRLHVSEYDYFDQPKEYCELPFLKAALLENASMRSAADHLDLPPIIFKTVKYDLDKKHMKLYNQLLEERFLEFEGEVKVDALQATALYNWAQKIILNPDEGGYLKDSVGLELLDGLVNETRQSLIFGNYKMTNGKLMERYEAGAAYGDISAKMKDKYINDFKEGRLKYLILHPKSAGYGLNLQNCQHGFYPELPITPRDFYQTVGRMYRQGQDKTVIITILIAKGTIQESLMRRLGETDDIMKQVIDTPRSLKEDLGNYTNPKDIFKFMRGEG